MSHKRNVLSGVRRVDWRDLERQNEYLNCVISAMGYIGKKLDYDSLACISGCAFRTAACMQDKRSRKTSCDST